MGLNDSTVNTHISLSLSPYLSEEGYGGEEGSKQGGEYNVLLNQYVHWYMFRTIQDS